MVPRFDPEAEPLYHELLADPDDPHTRMVYADWLEERGDLRAEWLRVEFEFRRLNSLSARYRPLRKRLRALLPRIDREWAFAITWRPYRIADPGQWGVAPDEGDGPGNTGVWLRLRDGIGRLLGRS